MIFWGILIIVIILAGLAFVIQEEYRVELEESEYSTHDYDTRR